MLTRRATLATALAAGFVPRIAWAQNVPDVATAIGKAALKPAADPQAPLRDQMQAWLADSDFAARDGKTLSVTQATSTVLVPSSNPDWVKARSLAYSQAYLRAQSEYIRNQMQSIMTTTVRELTKGPDVPPEYKVDQPDAGRAAETIRKILAVANGRLDGELRGLGIDPQQYDRTPQAQKTDLLRDRLKTTVLLRAFGTVAGMTPVMTFEADDGARNHEIGVIAVASSLMQDFARQVLTARGAFPPEPKRAADTTRFYSNPEDLLHQFGVRRCFDEQGLPVIVSFAQWGSTYRGTDAALGARFRDAAMEQATALADGQIADFLKGSASFESGSTAGQAVASAAKVLPDSTAVEDTKSIDDTLQEAIKRTAAVQIAGLRTLHSWSGRHPASPTPIQGVIRMWSAASEQNVRAMATSRPTAAPAAEDPKAPAANVTHGKPLMDATDF